MKDTKYLAAVIKPNGVPNLSNEGFADLMNVVHLEVAQYSMEKLKKRESNPAMKHKFDIWIDDYQNKICSISKESEPKKFIQDIIQRL
jgi:hypothetical protein